MIRHPVDVVDSWMRRGWGTRFGTDPLAFTFCICYREQELPYYARGWEATYLAATPLGRVIRMIAGLWDDNQAVYSSLSPKKKKLVFLVPFEDFVQRPTPYLQPLADFLGSKITKHTSGTLKRQNCPRPYSIKAREQKQKHIESQPSSEEQEILKRLIEEYEALAGTVAITDG